MSEYQWGVRTTYADDSGGIEWTNEDEARSFLSSYADYDAEPGMRVKSRELVRRPIAPGEVEVAESNYAELRQAADNRASLRRPPTREPVSADEHHFDVACDDRPYCRIPEHHETGVLP